MTVEFVRLGDKMFALENVAYMEIVEKPTESVVIHYLDGQSLSFTGEAAHALIEWLAGYKFTYRLWAGP